jgi:hypothetical protein
MSFRSTLSALMASAQKISGLIAKTLLGDRSAGVIRIAPHLGALRRGQREVTEVARRRSRRVTIARAIAFGLTVLVWPAFPVDAGSSTGCLGDCDGDGAVAVDELIRGVRLALGEFPDECLSRFDRDAGGPSTKPVAGVRNAGRMCPVTGHADVSFRLRGSAGGWTAGFTDHPAGEEESFELQQGIRRS